MEVPELLIRGLDSALGSKMTVSVLARPLASMLNVTAVRGLKSFCCSGMAWRLVRIPCFVGDDLPAVVDALPVPLLYLPFPAKLDGGCASADNGAGAFSAGGLLRLSLIEDVLGRVLFRGDMGRRMWLD